MPWMGTGGLGDGGPQRGPVAEGGGLGAPAETMDHVTAAGRKDRIGDDDADVNM